MPDDGVVFEDYSLQIKGAISDKIESFLYEIGDEMLSRIKRRSDKYRKTGQTSASYRRVVQTDKNEVIIGSDYMNAVWEEFGTGVEAIHGDGRKTPWRYQDEHGNWHTTKGKKARRPMVLSYQEFRPKIQKRFEQIMGELGKGDK